MQTSFRNQISKIEQKALEAIDKIRNILLKNGYFVDEPNKKQYNFEINITNRKERVKLLVYFGKKGIKNVLQGNLNSDFYKNIDALINSKFIFQVEDITEPENYIGSDESGKGDFFGPIVVAAFALDKKIEKDFSDLSIKDSKELSDNEIRKISLEIYKRFPDRISVIEIRPKKYNELYEKIKNLNSILIWAHSKSIEELRKKFNYHNLVIDKFCSEQLIRNELQKKISDYELFLTEKAERFKAVAIASILARSRVLNWFDKKSKEIGIKLPLGASGKVNDVASHIKKKYGNEVLSDLIKLHFKNFKNI